MIIAGVEFEPKELVDIKDIVIDTSLPKEERMKQYINQIKNPYVYRNGKHIVIRKFSEDGDTYQNTMIKLLKHIKQGD